MSEYWKAIPKKYCDVCKVWFQDNKASILHHESGWKHKTNVERKINDLRRRGSDQQKEEDKYRLQMAKIEAAALGSFQKDIAADPKLAKELASTPSLMTTSSPSSSSKSVTKSRFGEDTAEDSQVLVRGREQVLETISKKMEKKNKWIERRTAEGDTFYWNKETFESTRDKPKDGFIPLTQQDPSIFPTEEANSQVRWESYIPTPYQEWQETKNEDETPRIVDLQLPIEADNRLEEPEDVKFVPAIQEVQFEEKTIEKPLTNVSVQFKKRKVTESTRRNVRSRNNE